MRDLGFKDECLGIFYNKGESVSYGVEGRYTYRKGLLISYPDVVLSPTWDQAFEWFRRKFECESFITKNSDHFISKHPDSIYRYIILKDGGGTEGYSHLTYMRAKLACLIKLIELCKII